MSTASPALDVKNRIKRSKSEKKNLAAGILFAMPVLLGFLIFVIGPMVASAYFSLTDYSIASTPKFVGFGNYKRLFSNEDPFFYKSLGVTTYYVFFSVPAQIIFALIMALLLNKEIKGRPIFRTIFYLPTIVPGVASAAIWIWLMDPDLGLLNQILSMLGLPGSKWIFSETTVIPALVLMSLWTTGGTMIIFLAGLQGIPRQLYEAIEVDGGNGWHKFWYITMPMITPTLFFNLIMGLIGGFQVFTQAYIMTSGGPNNASLFYVYYLYREAFSNFRMGSACAIAWVLFIIIAVLTFIVFKTSNKWVYYEGGGNK